MNDKSHEQAADQGKDVEDDFGGKTGATLEGCASTEGKKMDEVDVPRTSINVKNRNLIRLRGLKQEAASTNQNRQGQLLGCRRDPCCGRPASHRTMRLCCVTARDAAWKYGSALAQLAARDRA